MVVASLLTEASGALLPLLRRAAGMRAEEAGLRTLLDTEVSERADAVYVRGDTLVIVVRSSVWATRVRFLAPAILQRCESAREMAPVRHVRVIVGEAALPESTYRPPRPARPSPEAAEVLSRSAAAFPADDPLRQTLERLARRVADRRPGRG